MAQSPITSPMYWEGDITEMEFSLQGRVRFNAQEKGFENLSRFKGRADRFRRITLSKFNNKTLTEQDLRNSMSFLRSLDGLENAQDDALIVEQESGFRSTVNNLFLPRDSFSIGVGTRAIMGSTVSMEIASLLSFRLVDEDPVNWANKLHTASQILGVRDPVTEDGSDLAGMILMSGPYTPETANTIASYAEEAGVNPDDWSGKALVSLLANTAIGQGGVLADGADPLDINQSSAGTRSIWLQQFDFSYSVGISNWFTIGARLKYYRAGLSSSVSQLTNFGGSDFYGSLGATIKKSYTGEETKTGFGVDAGFVFSPPQDVLHDLRVGFWGEDINTPEFNWSDRRLELPAQYSVDISWAVFTRNLPFRIHFMMDLNPVESLVVRNYHRQMVSFGLSLQPNYETFGVFADVGFSKNIGDRGEPWMLNAQLGVQLWNIRLYGGAETTINMIHLPGVSLPRRFSPWLKLEINIPLG